MENGKWIDYDGAVAAKVESIVHDAEINFLSEFNEARYSPDGKGGYTIDEAKFAEYRRHTNDFIYELLELWFPERERWAWKQYLLMKEAQVDFYKKYYDTLT